MKFVVSLLVLLVVSSTGAQRIKGGRIFLTNSPFARGQHVQVGKGGGGGALHHTEVVQDPISGAPVVVEKVTSIGGVKGGGLGASSVQLAVGDGLLGQRGLYRVGQSQIPYGLLGMDYGSFPTSLLTAPRGYGRKTVVSNNLSGLRPIGYGGKTSKIGGGGALHHTEVVQDPISGAPVVVEKVTPIGGVKGGGLGAGSVQLSVGDGLFGQRGLYRIGQSQIPYGLLGMDYGSFPTSLLTAPRGYGRKTIVSNNLSGLRPVGYGGKTSKIGGSGAIHHTEVVQDPISGAPVVVEKVTPIGGVKGSGLGAGSVQQAVVDGLFGQRRVYRVGQSQIPYGLMGLDYGSFPTSLLTSPRRFGKTVVSDNLSGLRPVGFGGLAKGGLAGIGAAPTTIVQQEDPITGLTTTTQISQVAQDPIETAIQETLGGSSFGETVQSLVDPLGSGQTQVSVDDFGGVTQVKETLVSDPLTGEVNKVTEVTKSGGALAQQNIADAIVQENIASGLGRSNLGAYLPRVSFLSQYPYDFSDAGMLRSVVSGPIVQQQQELEQILVK